MPNRATAPFVCSSLDGPDYDGGPAVRSPPGLTYAALLLLNAVEGAYALLQKACEQDSIINCTSCCIPAVIVRALSREAYDVAAFFTSHVNSAQAEKTLERLETLHTDVSLLAGTQQVVPREDECGAREGQ